MFLNEFSKLKQVVLALACGVAFCFGVLAASLFVKSRNQDAALGFNFSSSNDENNPSGGPPNGSQISLARLKARDGQALADVANKPLIMLVTVDPGCGACKVAADEMREVQNRIEPLGIDYYPVSVTAAITSSELVAPSHLLLNKTGVIVRTWPGSNEDQTFRIRMAKQIVDDTNVIVDTFGALSKSGSKSH